MTDPIIQIQYCTNCSSHSWCTHHNEQKYRQTFLDLQFALKKHVPNAKVIGNLPPEDYVAVKASQNKYFDRKTNKYVIFPSIGTFEVKLNDTVVFSKKEKNVWPQYIDIVNKINKILGREDAQVQRVVRDSKDEHETKSVNTVMNLKSNVNELDGASTFYGHKKKHNSNQFTLTDHFKKYKMNKNEQTESLFTGSEQSQARISKITAEDIKQLNKKTWGNQQNLPNFIKNKAYIHENDGGKKEMLINLSSIEEENQQNKKSPHIKNSKNSIHRISNLGHEINKFEKRFSKFQKKVQKVNIQRMEFEKENKPDIELEDSRLSRNSRPSELSKYNCLDRIQNFNRQFNAVDLLKESKDNKTRKIEEYIHASSEQKNTKLSAIYGPYILKKKYESLSKVNSKKRPHQIKEGSTQHKSPKKSPARSPAKSPTKLPSKSPANKSPNKKIMKKHKQKNRHFSSSSDQQSSSLDSRIHGEEDSNIEIQVSPELVQKHKTKNKLRVHRLQNRKNLKNFSNKVIPKKMIRNSEMNEQRYHTAYNFYQKKPQKISLSPPKRLPTKPLASPQGTVSKSKPSLIDKYRNKVSVSETNKKAFHRKHQNKSQISEERQKNEKLVQIYGLNDSKYSQWRSDLVNMGSKLKKMKKNKMKQNRDSSLFEDENQELLKNSDSRRTQSKDEQCIQLGINSQGLANNQKNYKKENHEQFQAGDKKIIVKKIQSKNKVQKKLKIPKINPQEIQNQGSKRHEKKVKRNKDSIKQAEYNTDIISQSSSHSHASSLSKDSVSSTISPQKAAISQRKQKATISQKKQKSKKSSKKQKFKKSPKKKKPATSPISQSSHSHTSSISKDSVSSSTISPYKYKISQKKQKATTSPKKQKSKESPKKQKSTISPTKQSKMDNTKITKKKGVAHKKMMKKQKTISQDSESSESSLELSISGTLEKREQGSLSKSKEPLQKEKRQKAKAKKQKKSPEVNTPKKRGFPGKKSNKKAHQKPEHNKKNKEPESESESESELSERNRKSQSRQQQNESFSGENSKVEKRDRSPKKQKKIKKNKRKKSQTCKQQKQQQCDEKSQQISLSENQSNLQSSFKQAKKKKKKNQKQSLEQSRVTDKSPQTPEVKGSKSSIFKGLAKKQSISKNSEKKQLGSESQEERSAINPSKERSLAKSPSKKKSASKSPSKKAKQIKKSPSKNSPSKKRSPVGENKKSSSPSNRKAKKQSKEKKKRIKNNKKTKKGKRSPSNQSEYTDEEMMESSQEHTISQSQFSKTKHQNMSKYLGENETIMETTENNESPAISHSNIKNRSLSIFKEYQDKEEQEKMQVDNVFREAVPKRIYGIDQIPPECEEKGVQTDNRVTKYVQTSDNSDQEEQDENAGKKKKKKKCKRDSNSQGLGLENQHVMNKKESQMPNYKENLSESRPNNSISQGKYATSSYIPKYADKNTRAKLTKQLYGPIYANEINKALSVLSNQSHLVSSKLEAAKTNTIQQIFIKRTQNGINGCQLFNQDKIGVESVIDHSRQLSQLIKVLKILASKNQFLILRLFENVERVKYAREYGIWLCDNFRWKCFIVDDTALVDQNGQPQHIDHLGNQYWPLILEKGLVQLFGSYQNLKSSTAGQIFHALTGCNHLSYRVKEDLSKNNQLLKFIARNQKKNFIVTANKRAYNSLNEGIKEDKNQPIYYILSQKIINDNQTLIRIKKDNSDAFWMKLEKFVIDFYQADILQLRVNHQFFSMDISDLNSGKYSIYQLQFNEAGFGCFSACVNKGVTDFKVFLYKEEQDNVMRLIGQAKEKCKKNILFDCCFEEGKYYVFVEMNEKQGRISFMGETKPEITIKQSVKGETFKNDYTEYVPVNNVRKQDLEEMPKFLAATMGAGSEVGSVIQMERLSRVSKISKMSNKPSNFKNNYIKQQFIEFLMENSS